MAGGDAEASCHEEDMNVTDTDVLVYSLQLTYRNTENTARYPVDLHGGLRGRGFGLLLLYRALLYQLVLL